MRVFPLALNFVAKTLLFSTDEDNDGIVPSLQKRSWQTVSFRESQCSVSIQWNGSSRKRRGTKNDGKRKIFASAEISKRKYNSLSISADETRKTSAVHFSGSEDAGIREMNSLAKRIRAELGRGGNISDEDGLVFGQVQLLGPAAESQAFFPALRAHFPNSSLSLVPCQHEARGGAKEENAFLVINFLLM